MADLAHALEASSTIRSRFRKGWSWLQWPYYGKDCGATSDSPEESSQHVEKHPVCTRSLELNADALIAVLEWANGNFVDISQLQNEAMLYNMWVLKVKCLKWRVSWISKKISSKVMKPLNHT